MVFLQLLPILLMAIRKRLSSGILCHLGRIWFATRRPIFRVTLRKMCYFLKSIIFKFIKKWFIMTSKTDPFACARRGSEFRRICVWRNWHQNLDIICRWAPLELRARLHHYLNARVGMLLNVRFDPHQWFDLGLNFFFEFFREFLNFFLVLWKFFEFAEKFLGTF